MADIRINSLPTTASASSSDDFLALDGATNGTRKLNAFSPTFGGNLTVSGGTIGTAASTNLTLAGGGSGASLVLGQGANGAVDITPAASGSGRTIIRAATGTNSVLSIVQNGYIIGSVGSGVVFSLTAGSGDATTQIQGIRSGGASTGPIVMQPLGGNFLLGTTSDSANGKIQLADHTTSAGGIGFGTDVSLYRIDVGALALDNIGGSAPRFAMRSNGTIAANLEVSSGDLYFDNRGAGKSLYLRTATSGGTTTTALTLDSSQNATFAGRVISNGTGFGVGANSDANTPFHALTTTLNGGFGALIRNTNAGANATASILAESDAGTAIFRNHSLAHSIWPGKTLIGAPAGGTGMVILTGGAGDPIDFWTNTTQALSIDASQNIVPGTAALATTATNGFIYLQTCAGAPTGVPTSYTGRVASIYDTTNNKLYIYNGGWKSVTLA